MWKIVAILVFYITLLGCSSGPTEEEIAASVEAQLAIAQTETVEAVPTDTPTSTSADTPTPINAPELNINWRDAYYPPSTEDYFEKAYDEFDGVTLYLPKYTFIISSLVLGVQLPDNQGPELFWMAVYRGHDWIFLDGVRVKVGDTVYDFSDRFDNHDVSTDIDGGWVREWVAFPFMQQDVEMLVALLGNEGTARLEGSDGNEDFPLRSDEEFAKRLFAAMDLFESLIVSNDDRH